LSAGAAFDVYERGVPGNAQSGGESRIFRHAHDDRRLVGLAAESRRMWRDWEVEFRRELLSRDGVISIGPQAERHLGVMLSAGGVRAIQIAGSDAAEHLPLLAGLETTALFDEDGGVIRARAAIEELVGRTREHLVFDEVMSVRLLPNDSVELRAGGVAREYARVAVCAGRGTAALARGAGIPLPIRQALHVRLTYPVRGEPPARLACLLDGSGLFGEPSAYADALPGNRLYAVGLDETAVHEDGSVSEPSALASIEDRTSAYVARALPGLDPNPVDVRHCWVTELPWSVDGIGVWEAGGLLLVAGANLFKHAPVLGRTLARALTGDQLAETFRPEAKLGAGGVA
jgi:sarcosine oxidase